MALTVEEKNARKAERRRIASELRHEKMMEKERLRQKIKEERERQKEENMMADGHHGHCQICGRVIQNKKGVIAHHGYTRPGDGWQTSSCLGARHLAYEESNSRIPAVVEIIERSLENSKKYLARLENHEVSIYISEFQRDLTTGRGKMVTVEVKPEDEKKYNSNVVYHIRNTKAEISAMINHIEYLKDRFEKWEYKGR